jgi:hypothetical protein
MAKATTITLRPGGQVVYSNRSEIQMIGDDATYSLIRLLMAFRVQQAGLVDWHNIDNYVDRFTNEPL